MVDSVAFGSSPAIRHLDVCQEIPAPVLDMTKLKRKGQRNEHEPAHLICFRRPTSDSTATTRRSTYGDVENNETPYCDWRID